MTSEELKRYGLEEMTREEMELFLASRSVGVLGLEDTQAEAPYLIPLSYAFDGDSSLYFTYVLGAESRKEQLTEQVSRGRFVVYRADTPFNWQSVSLYGTFESVPPSQWNDLADVLETAWRPEIFTTAMPSRSIKIYEFTIEDWQGFKHSGLSPGFGGRDSRGSI